MRFVLFILMSVSALLWGFERSFIDEFPRSVEDVTLYTTQAISDFDMQFTDFVAQPLDQQNFAMVLTKWNNLIGTLLSKGVILSFLPLTLDNAQVISKGEEEAKKIIYKLKQTMQDSKAVALVLGSIQEALSDKKTILPDQLYLMSRVLASIEGPFCTQEVKALQEQINQAHKVPFTYMRGAKREKSFFWSKKLTLVSWNVCLFDENLSMLFGGVLPWKERIDKIVGKIKKSDPDILCLQEVFSKQAGSVLLQKLRSQYAHFYIEIGPNPAGFSLESLGIPSGLFVASKYPLHNVRFTPYGKDETPSFRGYGFFSADIYNRKKPIAHLVATHLQPGCTKEDVGYRVAQIKAIDASLKEVELPCFLCGDFNIEKSSPEAEIFQHYRSSSYQGVDWTCCELRNYWWKAKQDVVEFCSMPLEKEWLDYFFCWDKTCKQSIKMSTEVQMVNDPERPQEALSDHQMLVTEINF